MCSCDWSSDVCSSDLDKWYSQLSRNISPLVGDKPSEAGSASIGGELIPFTIRRGYIRVTLHYMQYGLQIWSQECGNMELISGWARMNSSMERPRKRGWQRQPRRWILRSSICTEQIGSESTPLISIYFTCLQNRGSHNLLTGSNNGLNVSQLNIDRKSTRLNSSHRNTSRMPSSA